MWLQVSFRSWRGQRDQGEEGPPPPPPPGGDRAGAHLREDGQARQLQVGREAPRREALRQALKGTEARTGCSFVKRCYGCFVFVARMSFNKTVEMDAGAVDWIFKFLKHKKVLQQKLVSAVLCNYPGVTCGN